LIAAFAGWVSEVAPRRSEPRQTEQPQPTPADTRLAGLEAEVARLAEALRQAGVAEPLGYLEGGEGERVVFDKSELTLNNPEGVLLNLVSTRGWVGFRFYKGFGFGNETVDSPWSIFIEGVEGYQGLAFLRDWRFTAALWDEDGKLLLGRLHPHPPANEPPEPGCMCAGRSTKFRRWCKQVLTSWPISSRSSALTALRTWRSAGTANLPSAPGTNPGLSSCTTPWTGERTR
jgi:hypothetical protein